MTSDIRTRAAQYGRTVKCCTYPFVVWRDTEKEAEEERRCIIENIDQEAVETWARGLLVQSGSFNQFSLEKLALGGGGLPIFGTAEQVAEKLARLYRDGIDGVLLTFLDFYQDTIRFEREIKPLLGQLGVLR